ncbi:MAG: hypothetical protein IPM29_21115 [Planctomycetes bacterium]|nr:hypothetical protein [Planctomycetota bacterium]
MTRAPRYRGAEPPGGAATLARIARWLGDTASVTGDAEVLDGGPVRTTVRARTPDGAALVVKLFHPFDAGERVRALLRRPRAETERRNLDEARRRGLPVPSALGVLRLSPLRAALLLEDLGPATPLDVLVDTLTDRDERALLTTLTAAGELLRNALQQGLEHRDLHLGNVVRLGDGSLRLLDLHKARFRRGPRTAGAGEHRPLFLSLPWDDQRELRTALLAPLGLPDAPDGAGALRDRDLARRFVRCRRSSGPFVVSPDGARRRRDRAGMLPGSRSELPWPHAVARFERAFALEIRGIGAARGLGLAPTGDAHGTVELEDVAMLPAVTGALDAREARRLAAWRTRLEASGSGELWPEQVRARRRPDGALLVDAHAPSA